MTVSVGAYALAMNAMLEANESVLCCADQFFEERNELSSL